MSAAPRLTIGLPVFNGENFLERAVQSILKQTFSDFRLIILDNASTDRTEEIGRHYASSDARVEFRRNEVNVGAAPNFNHAFALANSEYFKWAAHDDELDENYLGKCVSALDANPDATLAHSWVKEVDGEGNVLDAYQPFPDAVSSPDLITRFQSRLMMRGRCTEVFGVIRSSCLRNTKLIESFVGSDLSLICELSLTGPFILIPDALFFNRSHAARYTSRLFDKTDRSVNRNEVLTWYDTTKKSKRLQMHWWRFFAENFRMIRRHVPDRRSRFWCYLVAIRWPTVRRNAVDLIRDLLSAINPRLLQEVLNWKRKVCSSSARAI